MAHFQRPRKVLFLAKFVEIKIVDQPQDNSLSDEKKIYMGKKIIFWENVGGG